MLNSIIDDMVQSEATAVTLWTGPSILSCRGGAPVASFLRERQKPTLQLGVGLFRLSVLLLA